MLSAFISKAVNPFRWSSVSSEVIESEFLSSVIDFSDTEISGLKDAKITKLKTSLHGGKMVVELSIWIPLLSISGSSRMSNGKLSASLIGLELDSTVSATLVNANDDDGYIKVTDVDVDPEIENFEISEDGEEGTNPFRRFYLKLYHTRLKDKTI